MDPDIVEQLNEQFREMSDILSQQNSLMAAQVRNMRELSNSAGNTANSLRDNANANDDNSKSTRRLSNEQDKTTDSVKNFSRGLDFAASSIMTFGKTVMDSSHNFQKYNNVVDGVTGAVADLGKDFGIVGQVLGGIVKAGGEMLKYQLVQADSLLKFNDSVSKLGAVNSFSSAQISEMGLKAGFAAKDLDKLTAPIERLGSTFKTIGNGAADSTKRFMEMAAVGSDTRQEFQRLGYSQTELVEAQADYIRSMGEIGFSVRVFGDNFKTLQKASLEYIKNLQVMSELTGLSAEEQIKERERAAADYQGQMYVLEMIQKIKNASSDEERLKLKNDLESTLDMRGIFSRQFGEDAGRAYMQRVQGVPQTVGLTETHIQNIADDIERSAQLAREGRLSKAEMAKLSEDLQSQKLDILNSQFGQAGLYSEEIAKILGGPAAVKETSRKFGYDSTDAVDKALAGIISNEEGKGPSADDKFQVARNQLTEAEIKLRTEFDRFNMTISLAVPAMNAMATAANTAADALKAMKPPEDIGPGIFGGILAAAGLGLGGMTAFKGIRGINALRGGIPGMSGASSAGVSPVRPGAGPAAGGMFKTPGGILLDPKQAEAYNALQQQKIEALAEQNGKKYRFGKIGDRLSAAGGKLGKFGKIGGGIGGLLGGFALDAGADMATEAGYTKTGGLLSAGSYAATGAGLGAMLGPLGALAGGIIGGGYGLYQNWDKITGKPTKTGEVPSSNDGNMQTSDSSFSKSVQTFGRLVTSYGRIVTSFGKLVGAFGTNIKAFNIIIKNLNKKLSNLSKLSIKPAGRELGRRTESPEEVFGQSVKMFGGLVTDFGKIVSTFSASIKSSGTYTDAYGKKLSQLDRLGINRDNKTLAELDEEEDLIDYIEKLKTEFKETTKVLENHREEEIVRHNFNEISMLKFRTNLDLITEKFEALSKSQLFTSIYDTDGAVGSSLGGAGAGSSTNAEKAMDYFTKQGWTKEQAAGIVGNLQQESGRDLDHKAENATGHYGIAQWDTARRKEFERVMGKSIRESSFDEQLAFIQHELTKGKEKKAGEKLRTARTASEAATIFEGSYERANGHALDKRVANAETLIREQSFASQSQGSKAIADLGRMLERKFGVKVSEHSAFNSGGKPTTGGHSENSQHYKDLAIDINAPQGGVKEWTSKEWKKKFDQIAEIASRQGYKVFWGDNDHKDHLHVEVPKIKAAQGGVFDGPSSGYPAELHGSEMVAPLDTNSILMKLATTPATSNTEEMNVTTSLREKETIEKITTQTQETMSELIDKVIDLINAVEDGNDVRRKMLNNSMQ